jgi:hypothetical protein
VIQAAIDYAAALDADPAGFGVGHGVAIWDDANAYRYAEVRGTVVGEVRGPAARAHIDACAQRYMGVDYPGEIGSERVILQIAPLRQRSQGL